MIEARRFLAAALMLAFAIMWGYIVPLERGLMVPCALLFSLGDLFGAVALARGWFWARWFGVGVGLVGSMNIGVWVALRGISLAPAMALQGIAFPLLVLLLSGQAMRRRFELAPSRHNHWRLEAFSMRLLSWAVILNIAAAPMLLSFACLDGIGLTTAHRAAALLVAATLALGVALVIAHRSLGLLLMMLGGIGTVGLSAAAVPLLAHAPNDYAFLLAATAVTPLFPGALGALAAFLVFARPIARYLARA